MTAKRDLRPLFNPSSVAVIGASDDPGKWGNWLARGSLEGEHLRSVYFVNHRGADVLGRRAYKSVTELPEAPELVALCVPETGFEQALDEALVAGARAIVGITAGFAETGPQGRAREEAAVAKVREAGAVLLGPNCLGLSDAPASLFLSSNKLVPGPIGLISQSGNLALELGQKAAEAGLGVARFASVGNQADLDVSDLLDDFTDAPAVEVICVYCEDFRDGRGFVEMASRATEAGKPVVLLAPGESDASRRAARSHTGALVSSQTAVEAACLAAGIERVSTPKELVDACQALLLGLLPSGRRVGVVADGGGHGAVAADAVAVRGLDVPELSFDLADELAQATGTAGGTDNPVDLAGAGEQDIWSFTRVAVALAASDEVDSVLLTGYFGGYGQYSAELARAEAEVGSFLASTVQTSGKPMVVHSMHRLVDEPKVGDGAGPLGKLREGRVPVYANVEDAAEALVRLTRRAESLEARRPRVAGVKPSPPGRRVSKGGYFAARALLGEAGFPFLPAREARSVGEAVAAADEIGYPVVIKAAELEHKSDSGGVALGVSGEEDVRRTVVGFAEKFGETRLSIEPMASVSGVELLVGAVRDPRFGPVVLVALGGIYAEVLDDTAVALAPVDETEALKLIGRLRAAPLLFGARGRPALALEQAAKSLAVLSEVAAAHPELVELEVNPLLVGASQVVGLDARMVVAQASTGGGGEP